SFRVDRILDMKVTEEIFERPHPFSAGDYFARQLMPRVPVDNLTPVRVEGTPDAIRQLCGNGNMQVFLAEQTPDQAMFKMDLEAALIYLPGILFSYGTSIKVLEPPALKEKLAARAAELAHYYQSQLS
ncbi:WYL domain-containing protein, partial [Paenibacillus sepulcri]|nr:WYL domain-containing protein [Paenibacillus sepulcri]